MTIQKGYLKKAVTWIDSKSVDNIPLNFAIMDKFRYIAGDLMVLIDISGSMSHFIRYDNSFTYLFDLMSQRGSSVLQAGWLTYEFNVDKFVALSKDYKTTFDGIAEISTYGGTENAKNAIEVAVNTAKWGSEKKNILMITDEYANDLPWEPESFEVTQFINWMKENNVICSIYDDSSPVKIPHWERMVLETGGLYMVTDGTPRSDQMDIPVLYTTFFNFLMGYDLDRPVDLTGIK